MHIVTYKYVGEHMKKIEVHQSMKGQFTVKYFIFREIWKIPCVVQIFPVLHLNSLCFPCLEKVITKFPVFPVPMATLKKKHSPWEKKHKKHSSPSKKSKPQKKTTKKHYGALKSTHYDPCSDFSKVI